MPDEDYLIEPRWVYIPTYVWYTFVLMVTIAWL